MKTASLLLAFPLMLPVCTTHAGPREFKADGQYQFLENSHPATYVIAKDEVLRRSNSNRIFLSARDNLRSVQATARQLSAQTGDRVDLVAYPKGQTPSDENRRVVSRSVTLQLAEGVNPMVIASAVNALSYRQLAYAPRNYTLSFPDSQAALSAAEDLKGIEGISHVTVELAKRYNSKALPPLADPHFFFATTSAGSQRVPIQFDFTNQPTMEPAGGPPWRLVSAWVNYQWFLYNTGNQMDTTAYYPAGAFTGDKVPPPLPGIYIPDKVPPFAIPNDLCTYNSYFDIFADINVLNAWSQLSPTGASIDGTGVRVAVMDDGVEIKHEDLSAAALLDRINSYNFVRSRGVIDKENTDFRDPSPVFGAGGFASGHGTAVAGLAVGRSNTVGGLGVAFGARLAGFNFLNVYLEASTVGDMLTWGADRLDLRPDQDPGEEWRRNQPRFDVAINSWGTSTSGANLIDETEYVKKALAYGALRGRDGKGVIYLFPSGNEAATHGNSNYSALTNSIYSIHVGSVTDMGRRVLHSTPGASVHVVAPSAGFEMAPAVQRSGVVFPSYPLTVPPGDDQFALRSLGYTVTPDDYDGNDSTKRPPIQSRARNSQFIVAPAPAASQGTGVVREYTRDFSGTSASTALVGGVTALMLQANPNLGWRDVQEILMRSAKVVDPLFGEWSYNALGMPVSHKYGAGLVDAAKAVAMAKVWKNLGAPSGPFLENEYTGVKRTLVVNGNKTIPDNNLAGVELSFEGPPPGMRVEHVVVTLTIEHSRRGDLGIVLMAPRTGQVDAPYGLESHLYIPHREDANADIPYRDDITDGKTYDFTTIRHWGTVATNPALVPSEEGATGGAWKLKVWDNNKFGRVGVAGAVALNINSTKTENGVYYERIIMPKDNNSQPGKVTKAEVYFLGTDLPSENLAPVIPGDKIVGRPGKTLYYPVRAITDTSPVSDTDDAPRAPILGYQFKVLDFNAPTNEKIFTSPNSLEGWATAFPQPVDDTANPIEDYPSFRFSLRDGVLTNVLTPSFTPSFQDVVVAGKKGEMVLTADSTAGLKPGMYAVGRGINQRAFISEGGLTGNTITLDRPNTADVHGIVRFTEHGPSTGAKDENTVKVPTTEGLRVGLYAYGNNTGLGARIAAINTQTKLVTLNVPNADDVNEVLFFTDIEYFWDPNLSVKATGKKGTTRIDVEDITSIRQGLYVAGLGISPGSKVQSVDREAKFVTLSRSLTEDVKGEVLFNNIRMFNTLKAGSWKVEASATNIFGTTRRQLTLEIRDKVTYDEWKYTYYPPITDPSADPDGDGKSNLIEYVSGGDPYVAEPGEFITQSVVDGKPVFSYTLDSNAINPLAKPELSSDLTTWAQVTPVEAGKTDNLVHYTVTLDSATDPRKFFRIRVGGR